MIEGAQPAGHDDDEGVGITVQDPTRAKREGGGGEKEEGAQQGGGEERRELVLANQTRLHPGECAKNAVRT